MGLKECLINEMKEDALISAFPEIFVLSDRDPDLYISKISITVQREIIGSKYGFSFGPVGKNSESVSSEYETNIRNDTYKDFLMQWNAAVDNLIGNLYLSPVFSKAIIRKTSMSISHEMTYTKKDRDNHIEINFLCIVADPE